MLKTIFRIFYLLHLVCKYNLSCFIKKNSIFKFFLQFISLFYILNWVGRKSNTRLIECIQQMGIIYVKFAQHISSFSNYLNEDLVNELKLLQAKLPNVTFSYIHEILKKELGLKLNNISNLIKDPIGVASIAQVHKAKLFIQKNELNSSNESKTIAIKIIKPFVKQQYQNDINFFYNIAKILNFFSLKMKRLNLFSTIQVFEDAMQNELNLLKEAESFIKMKQKNIKNLIIPKIYLEYSTQNVLVMEFINGVTIDYATQNKHKYDLDLIAYNLAWIFFVQSYHHGFFHADMHQGNILVLPDNKIALLDFGIVGKLQNKDKIAVTQILQGFLENDYKKIALVHLYAGYINKNTNLDEFQCEIEKIGILIVGKTMNQIAVSTLLEKLFHITKIFDMQVQPQLILLQKTTLSLEYLIKTLSPNLNPWEVATPWVKSWAKEHVSPCVILRKYIKQQVQNIFSLKNIFKLYEED